MTTADRPVSSPARSSITKLSIAGAICYALWGCLHLQAAHAVYHVGAALEPGMAQARVLQDSWNLLFFGVTAIAVALTLNIRNSVWGYWINLGVLALADTGLIIFVLVPGYMPLWPGLAGPILWVLGWALTTLALRRGIPRP
jgi:fumarate reductase subunit D